MAYFRSDIDIIGFFLLGGIKMSGSAGLFNMSGSAGFFLPRREPKGGRSGRWETQKQIRPPLHKIRGLNTILTMYVSSKSHVALHRSSHHL